MLAPSPVEQARSDLRAYLNSGLADHEGVAFHAGMVVCARIEAGEIKPNLKKPKAI